MPSLCQAINKINPLEFLFLVKPQVERSNIPKWFRSEVESNLEHFLIYIDHLP